MSRRNYWIVKHDRTSIVERPGWIWKTVRSERSRYPPNYLRVKRGDWFALISYPYYEEDEPVHQVYGIYEVVQEVRYVRTLPAYVIEGKLVKGLRERWVTIPNIARYYRQGWTGQAIIPAKSKNVFMELQELFEKYCRSEIDFWPLESEPITEQEVVLLFGANLDRLGYKRFERVQMQFPDATVVRQNGQSDYVEFKYYASSYNYPLTFQHKSVKCVCWIDDRGPKEKRIDQPHVIELRDLLSEHR